MYPCPCCGSYTFSAPTDCAIAFICPVCYWENDVFTHSSDEPSDENGGITLLEAQANYRKFGAARERLIKFTRPATPEEKYWREQAESGE